MTSSPPPTEVAATVADLVERQAARTPDAPAVVAAEGGTLGYADLDARANRLAHRLRALGVGPDVPVAISVERSPEMAVGLLGTLKAGGACLPLDPSYPTARLAAMLEDSAAPVLLTQDRLADRLPSRGARVVRLDADWEEVAACPPDPPGRDGLGPDHLAYVIYTSGSTGEPKGVMLAHRGLVSHHRAAGRLYDLGPDDRVLQFCSISFDVSIEELFPSWSAGAAVVLRPDDMPLLGRGWLEWLRARRVSVLNLPTAYWHEWVRDLHSMGESVPPEIRLVVVGGEKALGAAYRMWLDVGGRRVRWINAYGPAEASIMATAYEPGPPGAPAGPAELAKPAELAEPVELVMPAELKGDPPIGEALEGIPVYVLDEHGEPAPAGHTGELYVGGPGLARGYLGRPDLTAAAFVPDPASAQPGARMYRTGDRVRRRPDGLLEFVDRVDHQVKVRGFRIEPAEVEAALAAHPAVSDAVVVAREDMPGDKRLVAYVVAAAEGGGAGDGEATARGGGTEADAGSLRRFLAGRLPGHLVPSAFVRLDAFPQTPNGKVDREALPPPGRTRPGLAAPWAPPRTPTEEALLAIWSRVLGLDGLGVDDDFFELGGQSLLATQVIAQVREAFANEVPLHALFRAPTVAALAAVVDAESRSRRPLPPLLPRSPDDQGPFPLSLAQEQMYGLEAQADPPGLWNVTAHHQFAEAVDPSALRRALAWMVERHETLRTGFPAERPSAGGPPVPRQVVGPPFPVDLAVSDLTAVPPEDREAELHRRIAEEDAKPFDLARPPLFRAHLFRLGERSGVLVVTFDHLICDMTSAYVFLAEVTAAYEACVEGREPRRPALPVQFADYARWQRQWLTDDRLEEQYDYWRRKLAGMPLGPAVPFDHVPERPSRRIAQRPLAVGPVVYEPLLRLARAQRTTPFAVAVAAVSALLSNHGGLTDIVLSTTMSGRQRNELEGLIAMFAGVGRLRTDLSGDPTFEELVARARDTILGLFEHQDIPFMKIRDALFPDFPRQRDYAATAALIPIEILYFHAAHDHWAPGSAVVERPGARKGADDLFFRGQLQPLSITFLDDGAELWGHFSWKLDFYDAETVERLAADLERLLAAGAENPGLRLSELPVGSHPRR